MEIQASQKFARTSPRKVRLLSQAIKILPVNEALLRLKFLNRKAAGLLAKVIKQAVANATNKKVDTGNLKFKTIEVTQGPILKRWRATARGRGVRINKKTSHIKIVLESAEKKKE